VKSIANALWVPVNRPLPAKVSRVANAVASSGSSRPCGSMPVTLNSATPLAKPWVVKSKISLPETSKLAAPTWIRNLLSPNPSNGRLTVLNSGSPLPMRYS